MSDICQCVNSKCTQRFLCYRYRATPKPSWQTMASFKPDEKGECEGFWSIENYPTDSLVPIPDLIKMEQYQDVHQP